MLVLLTSYLGTMGENNFDLRLIPEYDGTDKQSVIEWLEKLELICKIRGVEDVASVVPLCLTEGAFAVCSSQRKTGSLVK